jgi:hypothetical protein
MKNNKKVQEEDFFKKVSVAIMIFLIIELMVLVVLNYRDESSVNINDVFVANGTVVTYDEELLDGHIELRLDNGTAIKLDADDTYKDRDMIDVYYCFDKNGDERYFLSEEEVYSYMNKASGLTSGFAVIMFIEILMLIMICVVMEYIPIYDEKIKTIYKLIVFNGFVVVELTFVFAYIIILKY